jgi:hypothetical protein
MKRLVFLFCLLGILSQVKSQNSKDSAYHKSLKNTVRVNLSNSLFFGDGNIIFGYERLVKPYQSFSINVGLAAFPKLGGLSFDSVSFSKDSKGSGLNIAADYRFYLKNENRHMAPRGVYIGPFLSYNLLKRTSQIQVDFAQKSSVSAEIQNQLTLVAGGFELGYQFLFYHDRIALDIITLGPAYGAYQYKGKLSTNLSIEEEDRLLNGVQDYIIQRFPGANKVFEPQSVRLKGSGYTQMYAYRFVFHAGFRF